MRGMAKKKKPIGRPQFKITDAICKKAKRYAAQGLTQEQIARVLGMGESTFYEKILAYPEFLEAIKNGQAEGIKTITNSLFTKAKAGETVPMIFYLKNRDPNNWEEVQKRQLSGPNNDPIKIISTDMSASDAAKLYTQEILEGE